MTKQEYIKELKQRLNSYPKDFQMDMLDAFEGHFQEGEEEGKSEAEIMEDLGTIDNVMDNISLLYDKPKQESSHDSSDDLKRDLHDLKNSLNNTIRSATGYVKENINNGNWNFADEDDGPAETVEIPDSQDIHEILIKGNDGCVDVVLRPSDILGYRFQSRSSIFSQRQSEIHSSIDGDSLGLVVHHGNAKLTVDVPERIQSIGLQLSSGDLRVSKIQLETLHSEQVSGNCSAEELQAGVGDIHTVSGDIDIDQADFRTLTVQSVSGDIGLRDIQGKSSAKTVSGDIQLSHQGSEAVAMETVSGDIDLDQDGRVTSISASSVSGDIRTRISESDYTAEVSLKSGDLDNHTHLYAEKRHKNDWVIGEGTGKVSLTTRSGDIVMR
jgi:DUF4097 and DUF4098 domain-containing protein YvlB